MFQEGWGIKPRKIETLSQDQKKLVLENFIPEIRMIWSHIKTFVGLSGGDGWEDRVKQAALAHFDDSKGWFKFIRREHLEKKELYFLNQTQEFRDFQGKLLKMMVMDRYDPADTH